MADKTKVIMECKCPQCHSEKRVLNRVYEILDSRGVKYSSDICFFRREIRQLIPPQKAILTMPVAIFYYDICMDCGTEYCFRVDMQDLPMKGSIVAPGRNN